jgi:cobalt-zinc-cadmium efflux system protein
MRADAVAAMLIGALILPRTLKLLRETVDVLMESTPDGLDIDSVRSHILELEHVQSVHDLHATHFATGLPVLTAHVVVDESCFFDGHAPRIIDELQKCVAEHFEIEIQHSTFQLESPKHSEHEHESHA